MFKITKCILLILLISIFAFSYDTNAQERAGVSVTPAIIEDRVDSGDVLNRSITITNRSSDTQEYVLTVADIKELTREGQPIFAEEGEETGYELSSWVEINTDPIVVGPEESREISFIIRVPDNASPGGHFGGVFLTLNQDEEEGGATVGFKVGTIVSLNVSGDIVEDALVREFNTDKLVYANPEVKFNVEVHNLGNALVRPVGFIDIVSMTGKKSTVDVNLGGGSVLPNSTRGFESSWIGEGLSFGRYEAVLSLVYGEEGGRKTINSSVSFWVIPSNVLIPVVSVLALLIIFVGITSHIYINRKLRAAGVIKGSRADLLAARGELKQDKNRMMRKLLKISVMLLITLVMLVVLFVLFA